MILCDTVCDTTWLTAAGSGSSSKSDTLHELMLTGFDGAGLLQMSVTGPSGEKIHLPEALLVALNDFTITMNGQAVSGAQFPIQVQETTVITQSKLVGTC